MKHEVENISVKDKHIKANKH